MANSKENSEYNPLIVAELIESAYPRNEHEACESMLFLTQETAAYFMEKSDHLERGLRVYRGLTATLLLILACVVIGLWWR